MQRAFELGIHVPKTLEGWSDFFPRYTMLPWLEGRKPNNPTQFIPLQPLDQVIA